MKDIVIRLRELRERSGMTQKEVAAKCGLSSQWISTIESGARADQMRVSHLVKLLAVYGTTIEAFFGGAVDQAIEDEEPTLHEFDRAELDAITRILIQLERFASPRVDRMVGFLGVVSRMRIRLDTLRAAVNERMVN